MKKHFTILLLTLAISLAMTLAGATSSLSSSPGTVSQSGSDTAWNDPDNVKSSNDTYATLDDSLHVWLDPIYDNSVKIIKGGSISGDEQAIVTVLPTDTDDVITYGTGTTDLWGLSWTRADVVASTFGVAFKVNDAYGVSNYLEATNFTFSSIPTGSSINGIVATVECHRSYDNDNFVWKAYIDYISLTVYYTEAATGYTNQVIIIS